MSKLFIKTILLSTLLFLSACSKDDDTNENGKAVAGNRLETGASAREFLSDEKFSSTVIEVVYVEGYKPTDEALNSLVDFIKQRCHKPGGVELNVRSIPSPGKDPYTVEEIADIEKAIRTQYNTGKTLALFVSFLDRKYHEDSENSVTLGVAYRNTSFAIFEKTLQSFSDQINEPDRSLLESTVLRHELSHLLGLVDLGTKMQHNHRDTQNGHHCNVDDCLMNYRIESGINLAGVFSEENIPKLDKHCLADLKANGGK